MAWDWELLDGPNTITEGPVWDGAGLIYTAILENEIRRYDPATGQISVVHRDTGEANGLQLGPDGTLYACEGGRRAVVAYDTAGHRRVLADEFDGKRLNSPNDVVIDSAGRVWFTDPRYGEKFDDLELDHFSVFRLTQAQDRWSIDRVTFDTTRPNGLLFSPDESTLYVAQSDYVPEAPRQLRAYPVQADGSLGEFRVLHDFGDHRGIDGMCLDTGGNIIATCGWEVGGPGPRIAVFAPDGAVLEEALLPDGRPTNCAFGGPDLTDLYVTTITGHLYRVRGTGRRGLLAAPPTAPFIG